jgi:catechol 2,3-dioxygenase-like lactoylglutathione lyase family enzyme
MAAVSVRYIVDDVDAAISFYCQLLGFHEDMHPAPTFAMLSLGDLVRVVERRCPDGRSPEPSGWNRFMLEIPDLDGELDRLREARVRFRDDIVVGVGGKQILLQDPLGNPIELFQPTRPEAALSRHSRANSGD